MGKKPDDIAREIGELREETEVIVDELARRVTPGYVVHNVASTVSQRAEDAAGTVRARTANFADDLERSVAEPLRRNPSVVGGAAAGLLASIGAFAMASMVRGRQRSASDKARMQLEASARGVRDSLGRLGEVARQVRSEVEKGRRVQVVVQRNEPSIPKRLIWVGLVSVMGTLGAILFQRLTAQMWRRTLNEAPPKN